jgi:hypothetical protein
MVRQKKKTQERSVRSEKETCVREFAELKTSWRIQGGNKICIRLIFLLKMNNLEVILARSPYT